MTFRLPKNALNKAFKSVCSPYRTMFEPFVWDLKTKRNTPWSVDRGVFSSFSAKIGLAGIIQLA